MGPSIVTDDHLPLQNRHQQPLQRFNDSHHRCSCCRRRQQKQLPIDEMPHADSTTFAKKNQQLLNLPVVPSLSSSPATSSSAWSSPSSTTLTSPSSPYFSASASSSSSSSSSPTALTCNHSSDFPCSFNNSSCPKMNEKGRRYRHLPTGTHDQEHIHSSDMRMEVMSDSDTDSDTDIVIEHLIEPDEMHAAAGAFVSSDCVTNSSSIPGSAGCSSASEVSSRGRSSSNTSSNNSSSNGSCNGYESGNALITISRTNNNNDNNNNNNVVDTPYHFSLFTSITSTMAGLLSPVYMFFSRMVADNSTLLLQVDQLRAQLKKARKECASVHRKLHRSRTTNKSLHSCMRSVRAELKSEKEARLIAEQCHAKKLVELGKAMEDKDSEIDKLNEQILRNAAQSVAAAQAAAMHAAFGSSSTSSSSSSAATASMLNDHFENSFNSSGAGTGDGNCEYLIMLHQTTLISPLYSADFDFEQLVPKPPNSRERDEHDPGHEDDDDDDDEDDDDNDHDCHREDNHNGASDSGIVDLARDRVTQAIVSNAGVSTVRLELDDLAIKYDGEVDEMRHATLLGIFDYFDRHRDWLKFSDMSRVLDKWGSLLMFYTETDAHQIDLLALLQNECEKDPLRAAQHRNIIVHFYQHDILDGVPILKWFHDADGKMIACSDRVHSVLEPLRKFITWLETDDEDEDGDEDEDDNEDDADQEEDEDEDDDNDNDNDDEKEEEETDEERMVDGEASTLAEKAKPRNVRFADSDDEESADM